jgi:hypothetical protein
MSSRRGADSKLSEPTMPNRGGSTDESPSAPAEDIVEDFDLRVPDPADPADGVNDEENTDIHRFIQDVGTGRAGLAMPKPDDPAWPPLPENVRDVRGSYFRAPDFAVSPDGRAAGAGGQAGPPVTYGELLTQHMEALGISSRRSAAASCGRGMAATLLSATGIGACFVCKRTRRLEQGEIAFYHDSDLNPRYVAAGWSMEINPMHAGFERFRTDSPYICFEGIVHIIRVPPGYYVRAVRNGHSLLLQSGDNQEVGVHVILETNFRVLGDIPGSALVRVDADHVDASPFHIISVPPNRVVAVTIDRQPHVLFAGRHVFESATLQVDDEQGFTLSRPFSVAGMLHYYVVYPGELGCVKVESTACFIEQPMHLWLYSPHVEVMDTCPLEEEKVSFASLTRLIVDDFKLALIRAQDGSLVVLKPGVHVLKRPVIHLATYSTEWHHVREEITAITADPLDVKLTMTASFRICDVAAFFKAGEPSQLFKDVTQMACSTMSEIIRSMRFEETLRAKTGGPHDTGRERHIEEEEQKRARVGEGFDDEMVANEIIRNQWQQISETYTRRFTRFLQLTYGIQLDQTVWGYQNFDLVDQKHQEILAKAVFSRSEARAERVRLDLVKETALVRRETAKIEAELKQYQQRLEAETRREIELINVNSKEAVRNAEVEAEYQRKEKEREIEMADAKARADAQFYEIKTKADADAYAVGARADAAKKLYSQAPQEFELELQRIQAQTVQQMKPQVILGDAGGASLQKALALMVSRMSGTMAAEARAESGSHDEI